MRNRTFLDWWVGNSKLTLVLLAFLISLNDALTPL